ncbi:MAG: hypothetical protein ACO1RT_00930 [Planctomycetaceae bacterium]
MIMRGWMLAGSIVWMAAGLAALWTAPVLAQPPAAADIQDDPLNDPLDDPYIRELLRRSRGDNRMLATSISDALRLKLDDFASQFLASLAARKPAPEELASLAQQISPDRLLRVVVEPQFSEPAKSQATAMLEALRSVNQSAERLSAAIQDLKSASVDARLAAMRAILAGGYESIGLLSVAAAKESDPRHRDELLKVMLRLGEGGSSAVSQLAIYGDDSIRTGAIAALIRLSSDLARPVAAAAAHDPVATAAEKATAQNWLIRRYRAVPSREDTERYLMDRLALQRESLSRMMDDEATTVLWTIGDDRVSVVHATVSQVDAAWRQAVDLARLLRRVEPLSAEAMQTGVATELAYRYRLDPLMAREAGRDIAALWGTKSVSAASIAQLIQSAIDQGDVVVAVAAISLVDETMGGQADILMTTRSEVPTPLVIAASHAQPRLRYHAAAAIGRLGFPSAYAGSSDVLKRWIEMIGLSRDPLVLLVETRLELAGQIDRVLSSMGYRVEVVSTVADAVLAVDAGGDLRFLISTTVLPDRSSLELVDAVRRRPLGRDVPIILHGPLDAAVEAAVNDRRWPAPVTQVELPVSAAGWSLILEPLEKARPLPSLSAIERMDFRMEAADSLGRIASEPDAFAFYEFDKLAGVGSSAALATSQSTTVAFGEPRLAVLSVGASRDSQAALADLVVRGDATPERRDAAANALLLSIERSGVLLAGEDLQRLAQTRQTMDSQTGQAIDRVLAVIGRRTDVGGMTTGSAAEGATSQPKRVSPPDI